MSDPINGAAPTATPPVNRAAVDVANAPKITIGGLDFPIPVLAFKQNRIVEPLLWKVLPVYYEMLSLAEKRAAQIGAGTPPALMTPDDTHEANGKFIEGMQRVQITEEAIDALATVVYVAITRGTPGFARGEFDNLPFGANELFESLNVILPQTGIFRKAANARASTGDAKMGEDQAAASTGIL